jgi:hypothetical protein
MDRFGAFAGGSKRVVGIRSATTGEPTHGNKNHCWYDAVASTHSEPSSWEFHPTFGIHSDLTNHPRTLVTPKGQR